MTVRSTPSGTAGRPDDTARDPYETAIEGLAGEAARARDICLAAASSHVHAAAEVLRARMAERGGSLDAEFSGMVEALRSEFNAHLDRLAATRSGS